MAPKTTDTIALQCPNCGLLNISDRTTCKRCRTPLDPTDTTLHQIVEQDNRVFNKGPIILALCAGTFMCVIFFAAITGYRFPSSMTTVSFVRGDVLFVVRLPQQPGSMQEDIQIRDNTYVDHSARQPFAIRGPSDPSGLTVERFRYTEQQLLLSTWADLKEVRFKWCRSHPTFPQASGEPTYDIALSCGSNGVFQTLVPVSALPEPFQRLIDEVPSPGIGQASNE